MTDPLFGTFGVRSDLPKLTQEQIHRMAAAQAQVIAVLFETDHDLGRDVLTEIFAMVVRANYGVKEENYRD